MSTALLSVVLVGALACVAFALNHVYARLAVVELLLNEGLPPGHEPAGPAVANTVRPEEVAQRLEAGLHVFVSRTCHACQRLLEELDETSFDMPLVLRHVDRPRPIASALAERSGSALHAHQADLAAVVGADPLPYAIAVGPHQAVARSVAPTVQQLMTVARDAGLVVSATRLTT